MKATADLINEYRDTAVAWDQAQRDAKRANPLFVRLHALYKQLRTDDAGRTGIEALMVHPSAGVRLTAACHSLDWAPEAAQQVLEEIASGPGLYAVSAKYTLIEYRKGSLNLNW
jgi:hypothetical protein